MISPNKNTAPEWVWKLPVAHRGLHGLPDTPENSLTAFRAAADAGYAIETDVRLLQSGEVVAFHDNDWQRLTGQTGVIEETDWQTVSQMRLLQTEEAVPLLRDMLQTVAGRVPLLIELKSGYAPIGVVEDAVLRELAGYDGPFALQVFRKGSVAYLLQHAPPTIAVGQLASNDKWIDELENADVAPHFLGYSGAVLPTPVTTAFRENGGQVLAWTLTSEDQQKQAAPHCDNIIFEHFYPALPGKLS